MSVKVLISLPWVALIDLVGKGPSFRLLKCVKKWFMFIGMSSSVVCLAALILFQKFRGLLVFAASSLACNPAVALRFVFFKSGQSLVFSFCPPEVIQCYGTVRVLLHAFG